MIDSQKDELLHFLQITKFMFFEKTQLGFLKSNNFIAIESFKWNFKTHNNNVVIERCILRNELFKPKIILDEFLYFLKINLIFVNTSVFVKITILTIQHFLVELFWVEQKLFASLFMRSLIKNVKCL